MGKIKKILENELIGGTQTTDVYPVTSIKAIYDENNERLDNIINRKGVVNISTNYNSDHIAEILTLSQALSKVPSANRVLGFQGKYLASDGWHTIIYTGDSLTDWSDKTKWIDLADKIFNSISINATFAGIAKITTNPGTPDGPIFYFAKGKGTYTHFGGLEVTEDEVVALYYDTEWHKEATGIASQEKIAEVAGEGKKDVRVDITLSKAFEMIIVDIPKSRVIKAFINSDTEEHVSTDIFIYGETTSTSFSTDKLPYTTPFYIKKLTAGKAGNFTIIYEEPEKSGIIGKLEELQTSEKNTIVGAINSARSELSTAQVNGDNTTLFNSGSKVKFIYDGGASETSKEDFMDISIKSGTIFSIYCPVCGTASSLMYVYIDGSWQALKGAVDNYLYFSKYVVKEYIAPGDIEKIAFFGSTDNGKFVVEITKNVNQTLLNKPVVPEEATEEYRLSHSHINVPDNISQSDSIEFGDVLNVLNTDSFIEANNVSVNSGLWINGNGHKLCFYTHKLSESVRTGAFKVFNNSLNIEDIPSFIAVDDKFNQIHVSKSEYAHLKSSMLDENFNDVTSTSKGIIHVPVPASWDIDEMNFDNAIISFSHLWTRAYYKVIEVVTHNAKKYIKITYNGEYSLTRDYSDTGFYQSIRLYNCYKNDPNSLYINTDGSIQVGAHVNELYTNFTRNFTVEGNSVVSISNASIIGCGYSKQSYEIPVFHCNKNAVLRLSKLNVSFCCIYEGFGDVKVSQCIFDGCYDTFMRQNFDRMVPNTVAMLTVSHCTFVNCGLNGQNSEAIMAKEQVHIHDCHFIDFGYGAIQVGHYTYGSDNYAKSISVIENNRFEFTDWYVQNLSKHIVEKDSGCIYVSSIVKKAVHRYNSIVNYKGRGANVGIYYDDGASNIYCYNNIVNGCLGDSISMRYASIIGGPSAAPPANYTPNTNKHCIANIVDKKIRVGENTTGKNSTILSNVILSRINRVLEVYPNSDNSFLEQEEPVRYDGIIINGIPHTEGSLKNISVSSSPWT